MAVGKINLGKVHSGNIYVFYCFVLGNERDNPLDLLFLVCLMEKTDMGTAYCGPAAACRTGTNGKHMQFYHLFGLPTSPVRVYNKPCAGTAARL